MYGRSDSECRREEGVKLMNLEKFIEVNNFMPVPPQKPPTANSQQPLGSASYVSTRNEKVAPFPRLSGNGNSKYVNLSMDSRSQSSTHEDVRLS